MGAIARALLHRERTGDGQYIDVSLFDTYFHCQTVGVQLYSASQDAREMKASGLHQSLACPDGIFKGQQHWNIILAMTDQQWISVCAAIGKPELATDPRFVRERDRVQCRAEINGMIEAWLAAMPNDEAALETLRNHRVPVFHILSVREAMEHAHLVARGAVRTINDPILGEFQDPQLSIALLRLSRTLEFDAPMLGEHNVAALKGIFRSFG